MQVPSPGLATLIVVLKAGVLVFGGLITYFSLKAYRQTDSRALGALALGFGVVTLGGLLGGVSDLFLPVPFGVGIAVDAALTFLGFAIITYSLYAER